MQIVIQIIDGETFSLEANSSDTVSDVKYQVEKRTGVPPYMQRIYLHNRGSVQEHKKLSELDMPNGIQLDILLGK